MEKQAKIYVAGHRGLLGSTILRTLKLEGFKNVVTRLSSELDLRHPGLVRDFFEKERPEYVFLAAAKVGGILANSTSPAALLYDNLMIAANVIDAAYRSGVRKLLNVGSSSVYPKLAPQPLKEEYLFTGPLEPAHRAYALAKIAAIELCDHYRIQYGANFISVIATNSYGPGDNFSLLDSHVIPALIRKMVEAKERGDHVVEIWGTGMSRREFLYVEDLADACLFLMDRFSESGPINVGIGEDIAIYDLALMMRKIVGFSGKIRFNRTKPEGTPRKLLDVSRLRALGWTARTPLREGIEQTVRWYLANRSATAVRH